MLNDREVSAAIGSTAYDTDGEKLGTVEHFFVDERTGTPAWVAVTTGLFGTRHSVVPAGEATLTDGALRLPVRKDTVKHAPSLADAGRLDPATEDELRRHYGLAGPAAGPPPPSGPAASGGLPPGAESSGPAGGHAPAGAPAAPPVPGPPAGRHAASADRDAAPSGTWSSTETGTVPVGAVGRSTEEPPGPVAVSDSEVAAARADSPDPRSDVGYLPSDGSMVRHEEQLRVAHERVPVGRMRLVKYVVTEEVQVTVPIRREEVRLEEIPMDAGGDPEGTGVATAGETLLPPGAEPGLPGEIVLHAERPVVSVEVVPVERVRLRTEDVVGQEQVTDRVVREQITIDES